MKLLSSWQRTAAADGYIQVCTESPAALPSKRPHSLQASSTAIASVRPISLWPSGENLPSGCCALHENSTFLHINSTCDPRTCRPTILYLCVWIEKATNCAGTVISDVISMLACFPFRNACEKGRCCTSCSMSGLPYPNVEFSASMSRYFPFSICATKCSVYWK